MTVWTWSLFFLYWVYPAQIRDNPTGRRVNDATCSRQLARSGHLPPPLKRHQPWSHSTVNLSASRHLYSALVLDNFHQLSVCVCVNISATSQNATNSTQLLKESCTAARIGDGLKVLIPADVSDPSAVVPVSPRFSRVGMNVCTTESAQLKACGLLTSGWFWFDDWCALRHWTHHSCWCSSLGREREREREREKKLLGTNWSLHKSS